VAVVRSDEGNHISERTGDAPQMRLLQMAAMTWPINNRLKWSEPGQNIKAGHYVTRVYYHPLSAIVVVNMFSPERYHSGEYVNRYLTWSSCSTSLHRGASIAGVHNRVSG